MLKLCVENLSFSYNQSSKLLSNVFLEVQEGECCYLEGSNGSGKTTFLRILSGLQSYEFGKITLSQSETNPKNLTCDYLHAETNGLFLSLSAYDNFCFWARSSQLIFSKEEFFAVAKNWGLSHQYTLEKLPVRRFSTGMKKKLALMRVFFSKSDLIFLDEPLNGLDQKSCFVFLEEIKKAKKERKIIFLTSHQKQEGLDDLVDKRLVL